MNQSQPAAPKKTMAIVIRKRAETLEVAMIENGELQEAAILKSSTELVPYLFNALELAPAGSHITYEITVR